MDPDRHNDPPKKPAVTPAAPSVAEVAFAGLLTRSIEALGLHTSGPRIEYQRPEFVESGFTPLVEFALFGLPHGSPDPPDWPRLKLAELLPEEGALGDYLEALPPGERLAKLLAAIDLDEVDDYSLVEVVAAHKRMEAWSAAKATQAAAALAEREALNPTWPGSMPGRTRGECLAGDELAVRLRTSRLAATRMAACGRAFAGTLSATGQALELGLIDFPRAQAIFTTLDGLPVEVAIAAEWEVLEKAPGRTLRQLQQDLAKAVIAVDPDDADSRHRAALQKRRVHRPRPLPDGMASFSAVLSAADAIALDTALDAAARAAKNNASGRTLDQLRADSLALMGHCALATGSIGFDPAPHGQCGCATTTPAAPPGGSAVDLSALQNEPVSGDAAASRLSPGPAPPPASQASVSPPSDAHETAPATEPPHPGHRLPGGRLPGIRLGTLGGVRADIRITVPLNVVLPDLDAPPRHALERDPEPVAELEGYGPIPPVVARALAAGGVWRRLVTDPTTEQVLDVGRTRYQPPPGMAALVRERDGTCAFPACSTPARSGDLDHMHEWHNGGETSVWNLQALCKRSHALKTIGAFTVARASDGTYAWTTPTEHGYLRRRDGTTIPLPRLTATELRAIGRECRRTGRGVDQRVVDSVLAEVAAGSDVGGIWNPPALPVRSAPASSPLRRADEHTSSSPADQHAVTRRPDEYSGPASRFEGPTWTPDEAPPF